ncbi:replication endonuclease, partial [Vibrio anguillarum]|nr:replication endonuclease [Vibrio anguillarum]
KNPCNQLLSSIRKHGDFSRHIKRSFLDTCNNKSFNEAMIQVQAANDRLLINGHSAAMSDDEIKDLASAKSR